MDFSSWLQKSEEPRAASARMPLTISLQLALSSDFLRPGLNTAMPG